MKPSNSRKHTTRPCSQALGLALSVAAVLTFGSFQAPPRAGEIRFNSTDSNSAAIETRPVPQIGVQDDAQLFKTLDARLDHRHLNVAEKALDEPAAQQPVQEEPAPVVNPTAEPPAESETPQIESAAVAETPAPEEIEAPVLVAQRPRGDSGALQTFTPYRTFGSTRRLDSDRSSQAQSPQVAQGYSGTYAANYGTAGSQRAPFNSSAYGAIQRGAVENAARDMLNLNDVREFSEQNGASIDEMMEDGAWLAEIDEDVANEERLGAITLADVADECFYALDPYSSLFIEYEPTAAWTESILENVEAILGQLDNPNPGVRALIKTFESKIDEADELKPSLVAADRNPWTTPDAKDAPRLAERYTLAQRLELLETFKDTLKRRVCLWTASLDYFAAKNENRLVEPRDITTAELVDLMRETSEVRAFFGDTPNGKSWRASFDVDQLSDDIAAALELQASKLPSDLPEDGPALVPSLEEAAEPALTDDEIASMGLPLSKQELVLKESARRMRFLHDRLNSVAYKLEKTPMTPEQRQVFKRKTLASWSALASSYACDQANGRALLYEFERYERSGGGDSGRALQQIALRMSTSRSPECRKFGRAIDAIYDNPNVKAYISEALINRLLPIRDPEFGVVQDRVLNNPVAGKRRVDTTVSIELIPDPNRLLMSLVVNGRVSAQTSSEVSLAKLHNQSYATYLGKKTIEWRDSGVAYSPASVGADTINQLASVETNVDFVPFVGGVAREMVRGQYELKREAIRAEMRGKVSQEARQRIDKEANERFDALNARLQENFFARMNKLGLSLKTQRSRTTEDWLLASLRLGSDYSLGCQSTEPATLDGAFADVKLHESSVNAYLAQLNLGGRESSPKETLNYLAEKLDRPALRDVELEENDLRFTFAKSDPVVVRFFEDQIRLKLNFAKMALGDQEWEDLEVEVAFRPSVTPDGQPTVTRDGVVEIYGPANIRSLLPLRAIFSKVFPAQKSFDLKPEIFQTDERFAGLKLGLCRIARGWFAISVVRDDSTM